MDGFKFDDKVVALMARVVALLYPDTEEMLTFRHCEADEILGTHLVHRGKRHRLALEAGPCTLGREDTFLPPEEDGEGFIRPIRRTGGPAAPTNPPPVPVQHRAATIHELITWDEAREAVAPLLLIVANAPDPLQPLLRSWRAHFESQPEIFAFMETTLLRHPPGTFSTTNLVEYARGSVGRAAERRRRFTLPNDWRGFYGRALVKLHEEYNGYCEFREDNRGVVKTGLVNRLLGCSLEPEPRNGEPYRRLLWHEVIQ